jgi:hypothetical protein
MPKISDKKGANKVRESKEKNDEERFKTKYNETSFG